MADYAGEDGAGGEAAVPEGEVGGQGDGPIAVLTVAGQGHLPAQLRPLPVVRGYREPLHLNNTMNRSC